MARTEELNETKDERLTREKRELRYKELRERQSKSAIYARCHDKNIYVRWVRKDDPTDIATHERLGFKIAIDDPAIPREKRRFDTTIPCNAEGKYVYGDVILMEIPRDDYDFYVNEGVELSRRKLNSGKDRFMVDAKRYGVTAFQRNKDGNVVVSEDR